MNGLNMVSEFGGSICPSLNLSLTREYYSFFYKAAFLSGLILLIISGIRSKINSSTWLIVIAFTLACLILGSKLGAFSFDQWTPILGAEENLNSGHKSALGAILFGTIGFLLVKRFFGLGHQVADRFAFFLPLVMLLQRIGCLMAGCCFGKLYNGIGGIQYSGFSFIRDYQIQMGWIKYNEMNMLPVHAVPFYFLIVSLITIGILVWAKPRLKNQGSLILLSLIAMGFGRFVVEFFRDSITNQTLGDTWIGLKALQWLLIIGVGVGVYWLYRNETKKQKAKQSKAEIIPQREIGLGVLLAIFIFHNKNFFTLEELMVLHTVLGLALIGNLRLLYSLIYPWRQRTELKLIPYALCGIAFLFMGQTYHYRNWNIDSSKTQTVVSQNLTYKNVITTQYPCLEIGQGCLGSVCSVADTSKPIGPHYYNTSISIDRYRKTKKKFDLNYGLVGQLENFYNPKPNSDLRANVYPYFGLEGNKNFGFRFGLRMGNMFDAQPENMSSTNFIMAGRFWLGYKKLATMQFAIFDSDFGGIYTAPLEIKLNVNTSKISHNKLGQSSLGLVFMEDNKSIYGQTEIFIKPRMALTPKFGYTIPDQFDHPNERSRILGGFGFRYDLYNR